MSDFRCQMTEYEGAQYLHIEADVSKGSCMVRGDVLDAHIPLDNIQALLFRADVQSKAAQRLAYSILAVLAVASKEWNESRLGKTNHALVNECLESVIGLCNSQFPTIQFEINEDHLKRLKATLEELAKER